jgi:hypothetical protein
MIVVDTGFFCPCHDRHWVQTGKHVKIEKKYSSALCALMAFVVVGCQTASLEDAAPIAARTTAAPASVSGAGAEPLAEAMVADPAPATRRNPGFASVIPIEERAVIEDKEFVATGARRTGEFPNFGPVPKAANTQMSVYERLVTEAEMTELLRARASTPDARAQYEARLTQLRALAASHASEAQQQIEN